MTVHIEKTKERFRNVHMWIFGLTHFSGENLDESQKKNDESIRKIMYVGLKWCAKKTTN